VIHNTKFHKFQFNVSILHRKSINSTRYLVLIIQSHQTETEKTRHHLTESTSTSLKPMTLESDLYYCYCNNSSSVPTAVSLQLNGCCWWCDVDSWVRTSCTVVLWLHRHDTIDWRQQCHVVVALHAWMYCWMALAPGTMW